MEEAVLDFSAIITVNTDNSVNVVEKILYEAGPWERHGIYRDIYPYSSQGRKMAISNIVVEGEDGIAYPFEILKEGRSVRIKIGDPDKTFTGARLYIVNYTATNAIAQFDDFDEIYWNVTGNDWEIPINNVSASINLPPSASVLQAACYYGEKGSTERCEGFSSPRALNAGEGLTAAVGFPKGIVAAYSVHDDARNFFQKYWSWFLAALLPILTLVFSLRYWHKKGRDPKGTGVVVPQYDVLDGLTPMEVSGIVKEKISAKEISAEIIYLATQGYLKIEQIEEKKLGIFKNIDYVIHLLKDISILPNEADRKLIQSLFHTLPGLENAPVLGATVRLSGLKNSFYKNIPSVLRPVQDALLSKGYYKNLGRIKSPAGGTQGILWLGIFLGFWVSAFFSGGGNGVVFGVAVATSVLIYVAVSYFFPAKTEKGVAAKEYLLGLKMYLQIAEKDRLEFHNAPEKKPEVFEKLLPYAMVLGVAHIWAKEFEGIYTQPPGWYSGSPGDAFSAVAFNKSISSFNSFTTSSLSSAPGGSGGGGSSGGGGGGGGGGGW